VHEEEDTPRATIFQEAIAGGDSGVGLATAGGHLHEGAGPIGGERLLQLGDGLELALAQARGREWGCLGQAGETGAERRVLVNGDTRGGLLQPGSKRRGLMEGEDWTTARLRIEEGSEVRLDTGGLVGEGERLAGGGQTIGQTKAILGALLLDASQRR